MPVKGSVLERRLHGLAVIAATMMGVGIAAAIAERFQHVAAPRGTVIVALAVILAVTTASSP